MKPLLSNARRPWLYLLVAGFLAVGGQGAGLAQTSADSEENYIKLEPARQEAAAVAEVFLQAAMREDFDILVWLLAPATTSSEAARARTIQYLTQAVLPFFSQHVSYGRTETISTAKDSEDRTGFAFYKYSVQKNGEKKPFTLYVLRYSDRYLVTNILVDHFVPNRHRPSEL